MGIVNGSTLCWYCACETAVSSLPLMGIVNSGRTIDASNRKPMVTAHYPSWGS